MKYGRLTLTTETERHRNGKLLIVCRCDCGNRVSARLGDIKRGFVVSCGCARLERVLANNEARVKHGATRSNSSLWPTYHSWHMMQHRCLNPKFSRYKDWGGRGITICKRWLTFENFLEDMGPRPSRKHSIDRIDNDGNYEPSNCKWALPHEQRHNRRR